MVPSHSEAIPQIASATDSARLESGGDAEGRAAVEDAIEYSCASLITLQVSLARVAVVPGGQQHTTTALASAITLVRSVIGELQELLPERPPTLHTLGFVAPEDRRD